MTNPFLRIRNILTLSFLFLSIHSQATHNLGGQIFVTQLSDSTYQIMLQTYTDPAPANVDRCAADIEIWKIDSIPTQIATIQQIPRRNGPPMIPPFGDCQLTGPNLYNGEVYYGTVKKNIYDTTFTFPGPGLYELRYFDIARHGNTVNIDNPEEQSIYLETRVQVFPAGSGIDAPTLLLNEGGIAPACAGNLWTYNPAAYDADCDSLVFELVPAMQYDPTQSSQPQITNGYIWPDDSSFGASTLSMDPQTGFLSWIPPQLGVYALAYRISTYRNGVLRQQILREISIWVSNCNNQPPVIQADIPDCAYVGDTALFSFKIYDPDPGDSVYLGFNNGGFPNLGPFGNPATAPQIMAWYIDTAGNTQTLTQFPLQIPPVDTIFVTVQWVVPCFLPGKAIQIDLYAHDNISYALPTNINLSLTGNFSTLLQLQYPRVPQSSAFVNYGNGKIELSWLPPPPCNIPITNYHIYRLIDGITDTLGCCESGAFQKVGSVSGLGPLFYSELPPAGLQLSTLCYVITAEYGLVESCISEPACVEDYTTSITPDWENEWEIRLRKQDNLIDIRSKRAEIAPYAYELINVHGQSLLQTAGQIGNSSIQMSAYSSGIYVLRLSVDGRDMIKKILW